MVKGAKYFVLHKIHIPDPESSIHYLGFDNWCEWFIESSR